MAIRLHNTLTRRKETFEPLEPGRVRMYSCGPTVYSHAHLGNLRTFLFEDLLVRHLRYRGYDVTHVMNITDVEDKIIRACRETGESREALTTRFTEAFLDDMKTLGMALPDHLPKATGHIEPMVRLVQRLRDKGHTYEVKGSTYYRISTFPTYGRLSRMDLETLETGGSGRVDADEYATDDPRDFALWKAWVPDDGDVYWDTEIGKGRPGWHLECSCMSMALLGESFDIHCGAVDLIFPHHENEIAQSEGATGKPFVKYWLHAAHLNLDGQKISKSLGNIVTLRDLIEAGHDPLTIKYALRRTHYRQPTNFSEASLEAAAQAVRRVQDFRRRLAEVDQPAGTSIEREMQECETAFAAALDDDLNISGALAAVSMFIRAANKVLDRFELGRDDAQSALAMLDRLDAVVGLLPHPEEPVPESVMSRVLERQKARRSRDFRAADAIRDELAAEGWLVEDTPDGPRVKAVAPLAKR